MKVIKSGKTTAIKAEYKVYCGFVKEEKIPGCGAELIVSSDDIYKSRIMTESGPGFMYQYMCPECSKCQILPPSLVATDMTYPWKEEFLKKRRTSIVAELASLVSERTGESVSDSIEEVKLEYFID